MIGVFQSLSSQLDTLSLSFPFPSSHDFPATHFFALTLPHLRYLTLGGGLATTQPTEAMNFWTRHPNLESLYLGSGEPSTDRWFIDHIDQDMGLLPNLMHLKVKFLSFIPPILTSCYR